MEQKKKDILKKKLSNVTTPTPFQSIASGYNKVTDAIKNTGASVISGLKTKYGPVSYDKSTYNKTPSAFDKAYPSATKTGENAGVEVYSNLPAKKKNK